MDTGDLSSESDWQLMRNPPDTDQNAWNHGADLIEHFFSPNGPFWVEINSNGELIASDVQSQFNDRSGSGIDTGGGSDSVVQQQQIDNGIDFLPTRPPSEVLDAVVSTNQQSSSPASPDPALNSPSVVVSDKELPAAEKAEISKMSSSFLPSTFTGENDSDVSMDISPSPSPPVFRATTPLVVGREGALTLPYGTDGTAGRTPQSAQQPLQQVPATSSNGPIQTLRATPNMVAATALYGSSPYDRGRHTQSTDGAESLRRDMEQPNLLPATTTAIPFAGLSTQDTTSPAQKAANEEESAITPAKVTKKRTYTRKPKVATETNKSSLPEAAEDDGDDSAITLAKMPKKRTYTRKAKLTAEATTSSAQETAEASESNIALAKPIKKRAYIRKSGLTSEATASSAQEAAKVDNPANAPAKATKTRKPKAAIETQMFAVTTTFDDGTRTEKLAKGDELSLTSPAPKVAKAPKRKPEADGGTQRKKPNVKNACSSREVRLLTGKKEVKEENTRKTRASVKKVRETEAGPDAGKAVKLRRLAKKE